jgi:hypothetical protein
MKKGFRRIHDTGIQGDGLPDCDVHDHARAQEADARFQELLALHHAEHATLISQVPGTESPRQIGPAYSGTSFSSFNPVPARGSRHGGAA